MKRIGFWPIVAFILLAAPLLMYSFGANPPLGNTGAPGQGTCAGCHGTLTTPAGTALTVNAPTSYTPGGTAVSMTVSLPGGRGFEATVETTPGNAPAGSFTAGTNVGVSGQYAFSSVEGTSWTFSWTPPLTNVGSVVLYITGGTNGTSYSNSYVISAPTPDFSLSASSTAVMVSQGNSTTTNISVKPSNGFTGSVNLSAPGLPSGVTPTFSPNPATTTSTLTLTATSTATTGTFPVTVTGTSGSLSHTVTPPITLMVSATTLPTLSATPSALTFNFPIGGTAPAAQALSVSSTGAALNYTVTSSTTTGGNWLSATPASGTTPGSESVSVNTTGLAAGTYHGTVSVASTAPGNSPQSVAVTLNVTAAAAPNLTVTPNTLTFNFQTGGTAPAAQPVSVGSTGAALNYTVTSSTTSGGNWLLATPASGTTPGSESVSVNTTGLAAGTYHGTVSVASTAAGNSPQSVAVTLTVTPAGTSSGLTVNPTSLNFNYPSGGGGSGGDDAGEAFGSQRLAISSPTGAAVSYTAKEATQSGGNWLMLGSSEGTTPGTLMVSVNPRGLASGIYHGTITITPSGAAAGPQMVPVTLTVGSPTTSSLHATPRHLTFSFSGTTDTGSKTVQVTSGTAREFTAAAFGGSWLNVSPTSTTTPATLTVFVDAHGLSMGTYSGMITLTTGTRKTFVYVTVFVATSGSGGGGGDDGSEAESQLAIQPVVTDPTNSGTVGAALLDAAGVPVSSQSSSNSGNLALALSKTAHAPAGTSAGAQLVPAESLTKLTELGFDVRQGGHCTANSPHFVVVTGDDVTHVLSGCAHGSIQTAPAPGWIRMRFDPTNPAQANIPIAPGQQIKSIAIVLDEGPEATPNLNGGLVVLDNIDVNGVIIGKD